MEWTNPAKAPRFADIRKDLGRWLPEKNAPDVPIPGKTGKGKGAKSTPADDAD